MELLHQLRRCGHYLYHNCGCGRVSQDRALLILEDNDGITQRRLQDLMDIRQGSLSELVGKLEDQGMITRACAPEDRRQLLIRVTEEGRRRNRDYRERRRREALALTAALDGGERRQLQTLLSKLLDSWRLREDGEGGGR